MQFNEFIEKSRDIDVRYEISESIYFGFQLVSSDFNPLHTDEAYAIGKGFKSKVMYGNVLNCFVSNFVGMSLPSRNVMIQTQDIQFRKPIYMYDSILLNATIEKTSEVVKVVVYKLKFYRTDAENKELVASGHVQVGLLHE